MIKQELNNRIKLVEEAFSEYLVKYDNPQHIIYEAMDYSLRAGGKRLRPILMLECAKLCNLNISIEEVMPFAVAMEMIHTYSLIHDDLPAMDNDDLRRGKPTNHKVFGEANAILAGDALLNKAFEIMSLSDSPNALKAINLIATSSGTEGMIGGQIVDMAGCTSIDELTYMYSLKTGAIIKSSCEAGATLGGGSAEQIQACVEFAKLIGIAFQIQDDVLDCIGDEAILGKPIGSDDEQGKVTFVSLLGIEEAQKRYLEYYDSAIEKLGCFGERAQFLVDLTNYLKNRNI